jgi:hypothetical protein
MGKDVLGILSLGDDVGSILCALHSLGIRWEAAAAVPCSDVGVRRWPDAKIITDAEMGGYDCAIEHVLEYSSIRLVLIAEVLDCDEVARSPGLRQRLQGRHVDVLWMTLRRASRNPHCLWQKGPSCYLSDHLFNGLGSMSWPFNLEKMVACGRSGESPPRPQLGEQDEGCEVERRQGFAPYFTAGVGRCTMSKQEQQDARDSSAVGRSTS